MIGLITSKKLRLMLAACAITAIGAVAVACGDDDDDGGETATSTSTSSQTASATGTASGSATASPTGESAAYPITVTDLLGREVKIEKKPETVVALSPTAVEYVYAVGGTVAGRPESATFPAEVSSVDTVGTAYQPSFEAVLALEPDLIVADSVIHAQPQIQEQLEGLGVPVIYAGAESYEQVLEGLRLLGEILDAGDEAEAAVEDIEAALADAKAALEGQDVSAVVMIAGRDETLYAAKSGSFADDILSQLGITNPAVDGPESGPGFPGYTTIAPEVLIQYDPDLIFTVTPGPASVPRLSTIIPSIPPFAGLKAVTGNKVIELEVDPVLQSPGPRVAQVFEAIAAAATS